MNKQETDPETRRLRIEKSLSERILGITEGMARLTFPIQRGDLNFPRLLGFAQNHVIGGITVHEGGLGLVLDFYHQGRPEIGLLFAIVGLDDKPLKLSDEPLPIKDSRDFNAAGETIKNLLSRAKKKPREFTFERKRIGAQISEITLQRIESAPAA